MVQPSNLKKLCCNCNGKARHVLSSGKEISYCRDCNNQKKRESYQKHPETSKIWHQNDYRKNKHKHQTRSKKWSENNKEKIRAYGETLNARFARCKSSAKSRNIAFYLSKDEYEKLYCGSCYYCSDLFGCRVKWSGGLDRLDSLKPYILENVVSCCSQCNSLKGKDFSPEETLAMVDVVLKMRKLR